MKCDELLRMLNDYVDGDIEPGVCEEFQKHLEGCNPCKIVVDTVRRTITLYKDTEVYELPLDVRSRLHDLLRKKWQERQGREVPDDRERG